MTLLPLSSEYSLEDGQSRFQKNNHINPDDGDNGIFQNAGNLIHLDMADCLRKIHYNFLSYVCAH
jgi:hypothetical protein